jgi:rhomboid protease GluP
MEPSFSEPGVGAPTATEALGSDRIKVYSPRQSKQWRLGILGIGMGLVGLLPLSSVLDWLSGGPTPDGRSFVVLFCCLLFLSIGVLYIVNALRGLPRLSVTPGGIKLESSLSAKWARWESLGRFEVKATQLRFNKQVLTGTAKIVGLNASKAQLRQKSFPIPDFFLTPIGTIVDELNAERAAAVDVFELSPAAAAPPHEFPVGLADFKWPWLTLALLATLIAVFAIENVFSITPSDGLSPSVATLLAMGGLSRTAVLSNGEWYRLFTAPLLHASVIHILGNGVALLLGGRLLEHLVGRLWFFAFFVVGALGGSLMSLAVGPANVVSVGASGALMGMFAALFVGGFRLPAGSAARHRLQINSIQVLIPSLLPLFSASSIANIDYGAHFGGALSGAILAAILLKAWPETQALPQLRTIAAGISIIGAILFVASAGIAVGNYSKYNVTLIPQAELPKSDADIRARATDLVARYPGDPRSHLFLGEALAATGKDNAGAERELRVALTTAQGLSVMFGTQLELIIRSDLAEFLADRGRRSEAKDIARPVCSAPGNKNIENLVQLLVDLHLCE